MESADSQRLLEYVAANKGTEGDDPIAAAQFHQDLLNYRPQWESYPECKDAAQHLKNISLSPAGNAEAVTETKAMIEQNPAILKACMDVMKIKDDAKPKQFVLTLIYDMLRQDSSCYSLFEGPLQQGTDFYKPLTLPLSKGQPAVDVYVADRAAWLLSALIGHLPRYFTEGNVTSFVQELISAKCSELGVLEATVNLLKADAFRRIVWSQPGVSELIFRVQRGSPSSIVYRCVFACWMLTFDSDLVAELKPPTFPFIKKIKDILSVSRAEKVVRLCLTLLKNLLANKVMVEDIVEEGVLEIVQPLEFEKWRDAELYDDIREVSEKISSQVKELSNFERYERELASGELHWGFIHSSKFWGENVMKFETNEFKAVKILAELICTSADLTTLAVACHDLGEFVALHPLGRKKVAQIEKNGLQVKEKVMELMGTSDPEYRDVRREALLCCQKIMLNKWQDIQEK